MNKEDREEMRITIQDIISAHEKEMTGRFNVMHVNLVNIEKQTIKTNGRVDHLEDDVTELEFNNNSHISNCPNTLKIVQLEKREFGRREVIAAIIILATFVASVAGLVY